MTELLTSDQMRTIEQTEILNGRISGLELMERAGRGVVDAILLEWPHFANTPRNATVLCGPGNNGGDGFVIARILWELGWHVDVFLYGQIEKLPSDARINAQRWLGLGAIQPYSRDAFWHSATPGGVVVEALFGIRQHPSDARDLSFLARDFDGVPARCTPHEPILRVVVDTPVNTFTDSGRAGGHMLSADLIVTFHRAKLGHVLSDVAECAARLRVIDIGLPQNRVVGSVELIEGPQSSLFKRSGHKFSHGHAVVLSGGVGKGGAARLAARGALRIGAGLVTIAPPPAALIENATRLDAIMLHAVRDSDELHKMLGDTRINALCIGPGMGLRAVRDLIPAALSANRGTVLDAGALSAYADDPQVLFSMLHDKCVLTPHSGEFARLFPHLAQRLQADMTYSKVTAVRDAAQAAGCTVLYKGQDTVIADPSGRASINASIRDRAAPWLATAGAGDVLAGIITGLLARGLEPHDAAATAAWVHTQCALEFGPALIAEDLSEQIPVVLRQLMSNCP